jgi:23S rRNA (uracil1939-C5)-methyltransferase
MRYEGQLEAKARIIRDAMQRIGRRDVALPHVSASPQQWRYRRRLALALRRRSGRWIAGLHAFDSPRQVFELHDCPITDERVVSVWREILGAADDLPDLPELRGAVRQDADGASLLLEGGRSWPRSSAFFSRVASLVALWWEPEQRSRVLLHQRGPGSAPGASFAQVNVGVAALLQRDVVARVRSRSPASVVDGYAGLGDTAVALAESGIAVTAIELDTEAAAWCARRLPGGSRSIAGRVEDVLGGILPSDVVLLNPPRAGVHERVSEILQHVDAPPRSVVYVSCNPATLARDVARMPRYRVASLRAFDMFPQTAHVETVCELVPESA